MRTPQPLPTTGGTDADIRLARQLGRLLGPWLDAPDGSRNAADLLAEAIAIRTAMETTTSSGEEAFVNLATELLDEYETIYAIAAPSVDTDGRRAMLLARSRAGFAGAPRTIVEAIRGIAGVDAEVLEPLWSDVTANPERVHVIAVRVSADVYGTPPDYTAAYTQVLSVVERMKPAHVEAVYTGTQTTAFLTDDPNSLTDNTILRA